jgi:hypothetical protein
MARATLHITIALAAMSAMPTTAGQELYPMQKSARSVLYQVAANWQLPWTLLFIWHLLIQALQREWPDLYKSSMDALGEASAENVVTGQTKAPAVRQPHKRKATGEDVGRVTPSFAPPVTPNLSSAASGSLSTASTPVQSKLSQSWGESKLTAVCQAMIDYQLLCFVICCAIAFLVVDSGFFIDFVAALRVLLVPSERIETYGLLDFLRMPCLTDPVSSLFI